jgi:arylformamidase
MSTYIDLSVDINEQTPVYPGDPVTRIVPNAVIENDNYEDAFVSVGTHVGTHVDAPRHMIKGGKSLNEFAVEHFIGNGVVINIGRNINLETVQNMEINEGDIVLFRTDMSDVYQSSEYYENYPALNQEIADFLVEKKVKMVGIDTCSVDHDTFPVHITLLTNNILIIENLTNLKMLDGKKFKVYALPIKLGIDGAPARVIAEIVI